MIPKVTRIGKNAVKVEFPKGVEEYVMTVQEARVFSTALRKEARVINYAHKSGNTRRNLNNGMIMPAYHKRWEENLVKFRDWSIANDSFKPSHLGTGVEESFLSRWIANQRQQIRDETILESRLQRFRDIGYDVDVAYDLDGHWKIQLDKYKTLLKETGLKKLSLKSHIKKEVEAARWVIQQRRLRKNGGLSDFRISELQKIGI